MIVAANRLPHDHNDMIFAVLVNRWGFGGGVAVLGLFVALAISMFVIASQTKEPFARLATVGFAAIIFVQASTNMAISMGLLPVTGITLPFISYGGSSLLTTFVIIGLVINFGAQRPLLLAWPSFEHDESDLPATT
jgi:cell division protein FtsW (lipid II flippase)